MDRGNNPNFSYRENSNRAMKEAMISAVATKVPNMAIGICQLVPNHALNMSLK